MQRSVFVIEDDKKAFSEIAEALGEIDQGLEVKQYTSLADFIAWLTDAVAKVRDKNKAPEEGGPPAAPTPPAGESAQLLNPVGVEVVMLICRAEFLKHKGFSLLEKTRDYFVKNQLCKPEAPVMFVLTAFDTEHFEYSKYESQIVANIIFKPFDKLILREHLRIALVGNHPEKAGEIYKQKVKSKIEMIRDVMTTKVSEVGFETVSDRKIDIGAQSKYYSLLFQADKVSSAHAKCISCDPHPALQGKFTAKFTFFNLRGVQISNIRKKLKSNKKHRTTVIKAEKGAPRRLYNFVTLIPPGQSNGEEYISKAFSNTKWTHYTDYTDFNLDLDPLGKKTGGDAPKDKPLPWPTGTLFFDTGLKKVLGSEPAIVDSHTVLGVNAKKAFDTDSFFMSRVSQEEKKIWVNMISQGLPDKKPVVMRFRGDGDKTFFLKISRFEKTKHDKLKDVISVEISEASDSEKQEYIAKLSRLPATVDAVFLDAHYMGENFSERWNVLKNILDERNKAVGGGEVVLIVFTTTVLESDVLLEKKAPFTEVFTRPFDVTYMCKRLIGIFRDLQKKSEDLELCDVDEELELKIAQPVQAQEVSETGLSLVYNRAIEAGSFRKVCLWLPHEIGLPEFLCSCGSVEEVELEKGKKAFICHFVYFGVRDSSLKHIRRWIKDYYVLSKGEEA